MRKNCRRVLAAGVLLAAGVTLGGTAFAQASSSASDTDSYKQQIQAIRDEAQARVQAEVQSIRDQIRAQMQSEMQSIRQQVSSEVQMALASVQQEIHALPQGGARPAPSQFKVTSPAYSEGGMIPAANGCPTGTNPAWSWSGTPAAAMSFAVIFHDTEGAPGKNSMDVTHWILWNIPASMTSLPAAVPVGSSPMGITQGKNVANNVGFQPPCPPPGATAHHYVFELYALDVPTLDLPAGSTRDQLLTAMNGHVIAKAAYVGLFAR